MYFMANTNKEFTSDDLKKIILSRRIKKYKIIDMGQSKIFKIYAGIVR
jgi:hypothetical protein